MNMLVIILFGSHRAAQNWFDVDARWNPVCTLRRTPAGRGATLPNGTEFRPLVVTPGDGWRAALAGLRPMVVIEHDSIRDDLGVRAAMEVHHHVQAYMR